MKAKLFLYFTMCFLGLSACSDHALLDNNIAIKNKRWFNKQKTEFSISIKDNSIPYHLYLNMRNSIEYPFSNIFVLVHLHNPDNTKRTYRVGFKVANREGLWLGKSAGNLFTHQVRFLKNYHFPDTGTYSFQIEHNMRLDPLPGISDIGLRIQPPDPTIN